jgi:hypothetical protein
MAGMNDAEYWTACICFMVVVLLLLSLRERLKRIERKLDEFAGHGEVDD